MNQNENALAVGIYFVVVFLTLLGIWIAGTTAVRGHSFYDPYCCSGQDCEPIDDKRVQLVEGGYLLDGKFHIPHDQARQAPDGNYHACFWPNADTLRCFYKPMLGS